MKIVIILLFSVSCALGQKNPVGIFNNHADIGKPQDAGSTAIDKKQVYTLTGGGYNIWFARDEFHYAFNKLERDFKLTANFEFTGSIPDPHSKVGWMVRESLDDSASHVSAVSHADGLTVMQWRTSKGAFMRDPQDEIRAAKKGAKILRLERIGSKFSMYVGNEGEALQLVGSYEPNSFPNEVYAGLFICSHKVGATVNARVWNVKIE